MKKLAISAVRTLVHVLLFPLELLLRARVRHDGPPPVFIIGAPRSGTSLLYEVLITRFRFAYISNLAHRFYLTPLAASWIGKSKITTWRGNFTSRFGHIEGWGAPNEGGWVWRRSLADGDWTDGTGFAAQSIRDLRTLTAGMEGIFGAPFLNKNVMHSNRLLLMQRIWPDALYIHMHRDVVDNVRSIVRAERKEGGPTHDAQTWWSVRPSIAPQYDDCDDIRRAVAQVIGIDADIARDIQTVDAERMLTLGYDDVCKDPEALAMRIADFLAQHGVMLENSGVLPESFTPPPSRPMDEDEEKEMAEVIAEFR